MAKTLAIIVIIIVAAALLVPKLKDKSASNLSLEGKMELAESYLQEFQEEGNAFFAKKKESQFSPKDFAKQVKGFNKIMSKFTDRINDLHLPCPTSGETRSDPAMRSYISWAERFEAKDKKIMEGFQRELNEISASAGFSHR